MISVLALEAPPIESYRTTEQDKQEIKSDIQ